MPSPEPPQAEASVGYFSWLDRQTAGSPLGKQPLWKVTVSHSSVRAAAVALAIAVCCAISACAGPAKDRIDDTGPTEDASRTEQPESWRTPVYGVTLDQVDQVARVAKELPMLPKRLTIRLVFDASTPPATYRHAVDVLAPHARLMGLLLDSSDVAHTSTQATRARAQSYVAALGDKIDLWEIGNEVNGEWLGETRTVIAKIVAAYDVIKAAGKSAALTAYYNPDCWSATDHEMLPWLASNVPDKLRKGLDYVLVSYYEDGCNDQRPSDWDAVFGRLRELFPTAALGFGEVGLRKPVTAATLSRGNDTLEHYYAVRPRVSGFVGGYFWWFGAQDVFSPQAPLLPKFRAALSTAGDGGRATS